MKSDIILFSSINKKLSLTLNVSGYSVYSFCIPEDIHKTNTSTFVDLHCSEVLTYILVKTKYVLNGSNCYLIFTPFCQNNMFFF